MIGQYLGSEKSQLKNQFIKQCVDMITQLKNIQIWLVNVKILFRDLQIIMFVYKTKNPNSHKMKYKL